MIARRQGNGSVFECPVCGGWHVKPRRSPPVHRLRAELVREAAP
ncbi:MAG TPA: hypothetical protein VE650_19695 [Acetobacteraceae bacterium]|nr:hypothetical protein [Acetobacteraceae bacterium]